MAKFSVNYSGIANAESRLHGLYRSIDSIAADLHTAANKVEQAPSLENKGYATAVRGNGVEVGEDADTIRIQGLELDSVGQTYSRTEKRILQLLSERVSSGGFSDESVSIVQDALDTHRTYQRDNSGKRALEDTFDSQGIRGGVQRSRFWLSIKGREMVDKGLEMIPGTIDDTIVNGALEEAGKKWRRFEDVVVAVSNPSNPDAVASGGRAVLDMMGLGGFADMVPHYEDMRDVVSERVQGLWTQGDKGKAVCYMLSASTLMTFQFMGDAAYNSSELLINTLTHGAYKKVKKVAKNVPVLRGGVADVFDGVEDWCWSHLDCAYGL